MHEFEEAIATSRATMKQMSEFEEAVATVRATIKQMGESGDMGHMEYVLFRASAMEVELDVLRQLHSALLDVEVAKTKLLKDG